MFRTCRISWQEVTGSDKYSVLSYVVFSCSPTLKARSLRAQHHISGKRQPHTALRCDDRDRFAERPPGRDVYVVDAFESQRLCQVDLDDYLLSQNAKRG